MLKKIARSIEMSFDIPESEKKVAREAIQAFKNVLGSLDKAKKHLDIIYQPFQSEEVLPPEAVVKFRGAFFRYKEQVKKNFDDAKAKSLIAYSKLNLFSSDTHILELINAFKDQIDMLGSQVNVLLDVLDDFRDINFKSNVTKAIDSISKEAFELENIINDRIIDHINSEILSKDWISDVKDTLNVKIEEKIPYITRLFQERQQAINSVR